MFRFATFTLPSFARGGFAGLLVAMMLQACGGGGGGAPADTDTDTEAQAQARYEAELADQAGHHVVMEAEATIEQPGHVGGARVFQLLVIDTRTRAVVFRKDMPTDTLPPLGPGVLSAPWMPIERQRLDSDGRGTGDLGVSQLLFIDQGRLMRMDLSGDAPGTPQQITALHACGLGYGSLDVDAEGRTGWVAVTAAGPSGDCRDVATLTNHVVALDGSADALGIPFAQDKIFLTTLRGADGQPMGMLVAELGEHAPLRLALWRMDWSARIQTLALPGDLQGDAPLVRMFSPYVDASGQTLIRVGMAIHRLSWQDGTLRLSPPLHSLIGDNHLIAMNGDTLYFTERCAVHRIGATGGAQAVVTLPSSGGAIQQIQVTATHVVVKQAGPVPDNNGATPPPDDCGAGLTTFDQTLRAVDKFSGSIRDIATAPETESLWMNGQVGNRLYVEHNGQQGSDILLYDLPTGGKTVIAQHVDLLGGYIAPRHIRYDSTELSALHQMLWCEGSSESTPRCQPGDPLISYQPVTARRVTVGRMPAYPATLPDGSTPASQPWQYNFWPNNWPDRLIAGAPIVLALHIEVSSASQSWRITSPWLVTPGVPDSLQTVPYP